MIRLVGRGSPRTLAAVQLLALAACGDPAPLYRSMNLPSGQSLKVRQYGPVSLFQGEEAFLLSYFPEASLEDPKAVEQEVDRLWSVFRADVERRAPTTRLFLVRPSTVTAQRWGQDGQETQWVFRRQPGGEWTKEHDPEVRVR